MPKREPDQERVSLEGLDPVEALKALLAVKPEPPKDAERQADERSHARESDTENDA